MTRSETPYTTYATENEDLQTEGEDEGTQCESCGLFLGYEDLVICRPCERREDRDAV